MPDRLDILVVGAGPTGLACAIEAVSNDLKVLVVEKGVLVNSLYHYPTTMTFFTTRERLEIGNLPLPSLNIKPHRAEALEYYRRAADFYSLPLRFQERVKDIAGYDGDFRVQTQTSEGARQEYATRKAIIATGYYDLPNLLNVPGEDLPKVSHYYTDPHPYYRRKVAVVGGGNSAAGSGTGPVPAWRRRYADSPRPRTEPPHQILGSSGPAESDQGWIDLRRPGGRGQRHCQRLDHGAKDEWRNLAHGKRLRLCSDRLPSGFRLPARGRGGD